MNESLDYIIDHWVGIVVSAGISIAVGYWVLSSFLPLDDWIDSLKSILFRKKRGEKAKTKKRVMVKCRRCEITNPESATFCSNCGAKL
jgi:ribosomal protein L40E